MIEFDGISFNELISRRIMAELVQHDPSNAELSQDQVPNRITRFSFMSALAKINGLPFFPKVAEFCDEALHACCDATVMSRGVYMFWPTIYPCRISPISGNQGTLRAILAAHSGGGLGLATQASPTPLV